MMRAGIAGWAMDLRPYSGLACRLTMTVRPSREAIAMRADVGDRPVIRGRHVGGWDRRV
jgi:hypothetical protein